MNLDFTNKVVLVTGASAGIGESTALLFAKLGAKLSLVGRNEANLRAVADKCEKQKGVKPLAIVADLGTDEGVEKTAKDTLDHFKRLDVLVNNAAIGARTSLLTTKDMQIFDDVFRIDVRGVYNLTRLLAPALIETEGNIVNISSVAGTMVSVGSLPYGMAKAALDHFTRLTALELAPKGVRVNTVSPGVTVSDFVKRMTGYSEAEYQAWLGNASKTVPMGEVCVGDDIAKMIVHVASDHSRLVTGTIIEVDGGIRFAPSGNLISDQIKKFHKVVLVTGASAGIGESTALLFAKLGAKLSLVGRNEANLRAVADKCEKQKGVKPLAIVADLGTDEGVEKSAKDTLDHFGRLDVLVNNAAIGCRTTLLTTKDMQIFDDLFRIDVRGVYNLTRLLAPALVETKGNIVNISSIAGTVVTVGALPYGMAKAALDHFTRLTALELAPKGVRVNTVSPGLTESNFFKRITGISEPAYQEWLNAGAQSIPMGEPCVGEDIARMVVFIASESSRLVTGVNVQVDGGFQFTISSGNLAAGTNLNK